MRTATLVLFLIVLAADLASAAQRVTIDDVSFALPDGWREMKNPKTRFTAISPMEGSVFGMTMEAGKAAPIPCEIESEDGYERGYWGKFEQGLTKTSHTVITGRDFRVINGVPFRLMALEGDGSRPFKLHGEAALATGNGQIYEFAFFGKSSPTNNAEIQGMLNGITFSPLPRVAWYQPLLHHFGDVIGLPLLLVAMGVGGCAIAAKAIKRKLELIMISVGLAMVNTTFIAGYNSVVGLAGMGVLIACLFYQRSMKGRIDSAKASGELPTPTPKQMNRVNWIMGGSLAAGVIAGYFSLTYSGVSQVIVIPSVIFSGAMGGGILWWARREQQRKAAMGMDKAGL